MHTREMKQRRKSRLGFICGINMGVLYNEK